MLRSSLFALAATLVLAGSALAQEAQTPPADDTTPTQITSQQDEVAHANGDWARRVLAGQPSLEGQADKAAERNCPGDPDGKPHGVAWGSVGSGGYKSGGVVATQRVGECSSVTVGYQQSQGGYGYGRRGRR